MKPEISEPEWKFVEIVHNDWCHLCANSQTRHKELVNCNGDDGYVRICPDCLSRLAHKELKK